MVKAKEDMTGWIMSEHGVPDSRIIVIKQVEERKTDKQVYKSKWLCRCTCEKSEPFITFGCYIRDGTVKSCGCLRREKTSKRFKKENKYDLSGNVGILWTTNTNEEVYFDLEDAEEILKHTWHKDCEGYATSNINGAHIRMHSFLGYMRPDHHDRNKLNNCRKNLIICTNQENARNNTIATNNTSGIIGISWSKRCKSWEAYIAIYSKKKHLGRFKNKEDAIIARLEAEAKYYGDFAPQKHLFQQYNINITEGIDNE